MGAETVCFAGRDLLLPIYDPGSSSRTSRARALVAALVASDGVIVASPGYHGTVSGLVKNCLDYVEDLSLGERPYLEGRAYGSIAVAHGWQAAVNTLRTLRDIGHALRSWPTPYGAAINTSLGGLANGVCTEGTISESLRLIGRQCVDFATRAAAPSTVTVSGRPVYHYDEEWEQVRVG